MTTDSWKKTVCASILAATLATAGSQPLFQQRLATVFDRLSAMKTWDRDEDIRLKIQTRDLTNSYILDAINQPVPAAARNLEHDLNESFSQAIGHMSMEDLRKFWGDVHYATVLDARWRGRNAFVVGYVIPHANTSLDIIEVAVPVSGAYQFAAAGGSEMENHALRLDLVPPTSSGAIRFLAHGQRLGANQSPVCVVLYQFEGKSLVSLWTRNDLWQGTVTARGNRITLTYQDADHFQKRTPPYFLREEYDLAPQGVKLASRHCADSK